MPHQATIQETLTTPVAGSYDVVVVGGGASGTVAAIAAARSGARTLLLERGGCLGGAATANLVAQWVAFYHGDTRVVGGIPFELTQRVQRKGRTIFSAGDDLPTNADNAAQAGGEVLFHIAVVLLAVGRGHQHVHVAADDLVLCITK